MKRAKPGAGGNSRGKIQNLLLEQLTTPQVERLLQNDTPLFLPLGTLEAHGRHLPVGTDTLCALGVSKAMAKEFKGIVAPPLSYGLTNLLAQTAPGSFYSDDLYKTFVEATLRAYVKHGFKKIVIVNGHGGNRNSLLNIARGIVREGPLALCVIHWWLLAETSAKEVYKGLGGHAAVEETAAMLYFYPDLVDPARYEPALDDFPPHEGMWCYPPHGEVLLYGNDPKGRPDFDPEKAKGFMELTLKEIGKRLAKWFRHLPRLKGGLRP